MARIHIITFGCTLNQADSELMAGLIKDAGHDIIDTASDADLVIINSCTVKEQAENKLFRKIHEVSNAKISPRIIVAGCVSQAEKGYLMSKLRDLSVIGTKQLNQITDVVTETLKGNIVHLLEQGTNQRFNLPIIRRNDIIGIVPIAEGCLGDCTYCKSRFARGTLQSYPLDVIINQIHLHLDAGCKEIWLTAQDCGAYGKDINTNFPTLLRRVLEIEGDHMIRLGMANPHYVLEYLNDIIDLFKHSKNLFRFIHIPIQAANNRILKLMNRKYSKEEFIRVCKTLRRQLPDITLATDVICGFPSETEEEFQETLDLIRTIKPDVLNRSRFWARPGTAAEKLPGQLHGRDTNARSRLLEKVFRKVALERNSFWKAKETTLIIEEKVKDKDGVSTWIGRNTSYRPVSIEENIYTLSPGQKVKVKITQVHDTFLEGINI